MTNERTPKRKNRVEVFSLPEEIRVEKDVKVTMRGGMRMCANIFLPEKGGRFPVILSFSLYGKDIDPTRKAEETEGRLETVGLSLGSCRVSECTPFKACFRIDCGQ